jgi:hypothetical protein
MAYLAHGRGKPGHAGCRYQDRPDSPQVRSEKYLGECKFQGRENRKIQFAILASASARGGIQPDLLDEVAWWQAAAKAPAVAHLPLDRRAMSPAASGGRTVEPVTKEDF